MNGSADTSADIPALTHQLQQLITEDHPELLAPFELLMQAVQDGPPESTKTLLLMAITAMHDTGIGAEAGLALVAQGLDDQQIPDAVKKLDGVMHLLQGIRAVNNLNTSKANIQSENFMRFLLLLSKDLQALLAVKGIKLYLLRHADTMKEEVIASLVADLEHLYLPLAHRLGLYQIKAEMEDFVMRQRHPKIHLHITQSLKDSEAERQEYIEQFLSPVRDTLAAANIPCIIKYRVKTIASIWRKMQAQRVGVEGVYDVFAIRIIYTGDEQNGKRMCWEIYSLITDLYKPDPSRLRDWISAPRPSGYESLHTTVEGPGKKPVEVQIRTVRMDQEAEEGPAAHWRYKEGRKKGSDAWLTKARGLIAQLSEGSASAEQKSRLTDTLPTEIFTMTPAGHLVRLKPGATVLDFAFEVHTEVGLRCKGARINGRITPIRHRLDNGDTVEILTGSQPNVAEDWLKIVVSAKARNRIRKALQERAERDVVTGRELLERKLRQWKEGTLDDHVTRLLQHFRLKDVALLYRQLGTGKITAPQVRKVLKQETEVSSDTGVRETKAPQASSQPDEGVLVINEELETTAWQMAQCCSPVSGDPVFGFVTVGKGIRVHRQNCPNAGEMKGRYPYRIIPVRWASKGEIGLNVRVEVSGIDKLGIVNAITDMITGDGKVKMRSINFRSGAGRFRGEMRLWVSDKEHLEWVVRKIQQVHGVEKVATNLA